MTPADLSAASSAARRCCAWREPSTARQRPPCSGADQKPRRLCQRVSTRSPSARRAIARECGSRACRGCQHAEVVTSMWPRCIAQSVTAPARPRNQSFQKGFQKRFWRSFFCCRAPGVRNAGVAPHAAEHTSVVTAERSADPHHGLVQRTHQGFLASAEAVVSRLDLIQPAS